MCPALARWLYCGCRKLLRAGRTCGLSDAGEEPWGWDMPAAVVRLGEGTGVGSTSVALERQENIAGCGGRYAYSFTEAEEEC